MATEAEIEILVRVVDQFTSSVDAMGKKLEDFERRLARAEASAASMGSRSTDGMTSLASASGSAGSAISTAFAAGEAAIGMVDKVLSTVKANLQEFSLMAALVGTALERAFSAPALDLIKSGLAYDDLRTKTIGTYETMFQGMQNVGEESERLYERIQRLADFTPFSSSPLITGSQLFAAIGLNPEEIMIVTNMITNALTAMNKTSEASYQRVTVALSKMISTGKMGAYEMTQLTRDGIQAWQLVAEGLGITTAALRKMTEEGALPANKALQALVDAVGNKFQDLAVKNSKTLTGLMNTLGDYKDRFAGMFSQELYGSILKSMGALVEFLPLAAESFMTLSSGAKSVITMFLTIAAAVGPLLIGFAAMALIMSFLMTPMGLLAVAATAVTAAFIAMGTAILTDFGGIATSMGDTLTEIGDMILNFAGNMAIWGANVIVMFANGMASGVGAIVGVINVIGDLLAYWLAPGSPPRAAPDLREWGMNITVQLLEGMSAPVVEGFMKFSSLVETQLRNAFRTTGGFDLWEAISGSQEWLARAMDDMSRFGDLTEETMNGIRSTVGPLSEDIIEQARVFGDLARTTERLNDAQRILKGLQQDMKKELRPGEKELEKLRLQQRQLQIEEELARIGARTGKSAQFSPFDLEENDIKRRMLEIEREQNKIKLGYKDQIDGVENQVESLKEVKDELTEQSKKYEDIIGYQKKMIGLWDEFHKAAGGGGGGAGGEGLAGKLGLTGPGGLEEQIAESKARMSEAWAGFSEKLAPFTEALDILKEGLPNPFKEMLTDIRDMGNELNNIFFALTGKQLLKANTTSEEARQKRDKKIFGSEDDEFYAERKKFYDEQKVYTSSGASAGTILDVPNFWDNPQMQKIKAIMDLWGLNVQTMRQIMEVFSPVLDLWTKAIEKTFRKLVDKGLEVSLFLNILLSEGLTNFYNNIEAGKRTLQEWDKALATFVTDAWAKWNSALSIGRRSFELVTGQFDALKTALGNLISAIFGFIAKIPGMGGTKPPAEAKDGGGGGSNPVGADPNYDDSALVSSRTGGSNNSYYDQLMGFMSSPYKMRNGANYGGGMVSSRQSAVNMTNVFQISAHDEEGSKRLKYMLDDSAQQAIQRLVDAGSRATSGE